MDWILGDVVKTHGTTGLAPILNPPPGPAGAPMPLPPNVPPGPPPAEPGAAIVPAPAGTQPPPVAPAGTAPAPQAGTTMGAAPTVPSINIMPGPATGVAPGAPQAGLVPSAPQSSAVPGYTPTSNTLSRPPYAPAWPAAQGGSPPPTGTTVVPWPAAQGAVPAATPGSTPGQVYVPPPYIAPMTVPQGAVSNTAAPLAPERPADQGRKGLLWKLFHRDS